MASTYYIKVYFDKPGQSQPEIRRFPIDTSPERDVYGDLYSKVSSLFADNQQKTFTLQYIDEDNERITFSTNDEFRAALALNQTGNTLKVFAILKQAVSQENPQQTATTGNKEHHVGVTCDGCNSGVIGYRFKCLVCPNYDLCEKCSSAGVHSEHNMIKITKPGSFHPPGLHFPPPPHHPHHPPPPHVHGHHRRHGHGRHSPHHHPRFPPFVPNSDLLQQIQTQIPQWLPNRDNVAHANAHIQQHLDAIKTTAQGHMQNSKEYLQSVGQFLQQALSPLGIDCDYHVDETSPASTTATATATATTSSSSTTTTNMTNNAEQQVPPTTEAAPISVPAATSVVETTSDDMVVIDHDQIEKPGISSSVIPVVENLAPEQAVQSCLEKLTAMGFSSSNRALHDLVWAKNGDINAVLDAINPRN